MPKKKHATPPRYDLWRDELDSLFAQARKGTRYAFNVRNHNPKVKQHPLNRRRAESAALAMCAFERVGYGRGVEEASTIVRDFLCDLMHLCDREGIDFERAIYIASTNYAFELEEPEG